MNLYRQCPKCGQSSEHALAYIPPQPNDQVRWWNRGCTKDHPGHEHMHLTCRICDYPTWTDCDDAKGTT